MKIWILYSKNWQDSWEMKQLVSTAPKFNIEVEIYNPADFDIIIDNDKNTCYIQGEKKELPDLLWPRLGAGATYFALSVIRHLEHKGVRTLNSSRSIEKVKDKLFTQQILSEKGFPLPRTMLLKHPVDISRVEKILGAPVVIKTLSGSQGKGVFLANNMKELSNYVDILESTAPTANIILQEMIKESYGQDIRVFVLGGVPLFAMKRIAGEKGFQANISAGGHAEKIEITDEIRWIATQSTNIVGLELSGVDLLISDDGYKICEINSNPGWKGLQTVTDINITEELFKYFSHIIKH